jgi:hypothetical protein
MLLVFFDANGSIYMNFAPKGKTINAKLREECLS